MNFHTGKYKSRKFICFFIEYARADHRSRIQKLFSEDTMDKLGSYITSAESLANTIGGTSGAGQLDRGNGKIVNWSFKGQLMGFEWKYIGICVDQATGETATAVKQSRAGSIEHSMRDLFQRLAARNAL